MVVEVRDVGLQCYKLNSQYLTEDHVLIVAREYTRIHAFLSDIARQHGSPQEQLLLKFLELELVDYLDPINL